MTNIERPPETHKQAEPAGNVDWKTLHRATLAGRIKLRVGNAIKSSVAVLEEFAEACATKNRFSG